MQPLDLLAPAETLLASSNHRPPQVNLRRATSAAYYALFHCLARTGANLLVGGTGAAKSRWAWRQTYRALEHRAAKTACTPTGKAAAILPQFPPAIQDFANAFVTMQEKRHDADYDPYVKLTKSAVAADIALVRQAITGFIAEPTKDRRAFVAHVLFKSRD